MPAPAQAAAEAAVTVDRLVMRYGPLVAVDELSLRVGSGTVTAVVGPNGAGKTTTLETCAGYRVPDAGSVRVLGCDPVREAPRLRPRVGVLLQSGGVWPGCSAVEALRHAVAMHSRPLPVTGLLDRVGLAGCARTPYRRLSGGQQQRLGLALALVGRPELVFLDEPTAGLDPRARRDAWVLVRELRAGGVTVVLSTHYLDEAEQLADQVVIVDRGRVVAAGAPSDLVGRGAENTVRFSARTGLDVLALRAGLPPGCEVDEPAAGRYVVTGPVDPALVAAVTGWCAASDVLVRDLTVEHRTLEDVFLDLTGRKASW